MMILDPCRQKFFSLLVKIYLNSHLIRGTKGFFFFNEEQLKGIGWLSSEKTSVSEELQTSPIPWATKRDEMNYSGRGAGWE